MDSTETTPTRRIPRAILVPALALGVAAGGYGIASAASDGGTSIPASSTPTVTQQSPASGDTLAPVQNSETPDGTQGSDGRTGPNGEDCDPADGQGPGGAGGYGNSSSGGTRPSSSGTTDTSLSTDLGETAL